METIAEQLTQRLVLSGKIKESKQDIIRYGFEISISTLLIFVSILILSILFFENYDGIVFTLFFASVRVFSGGLHASTYYRCYILSLSVFCFIAIGAAIFPIYSVCLKMAVILLCYSYIYAKTPRINKNHPISERIAARCKVRVKNITRINFLLILLLSLLNEHYSSVAVYTTIAVVFFMFLTD